MKFLHLLWSNLQRKRLRTWLTLASIVVAFLLSRAAKWTPAFTILALAAGLIPLLIFWVEHRVSQRFKAEHPELA